MANFQIYLLTPRIEDYHVKFLKNLMCDYTSQTARLNYNLSSLDNYQYQESFCYTFDESFQISQHAKKTLTFSMMQKIFLHNEWIDNPFVSSVKNGSIILLVDKYNNHHIMTVKNIEYADINEINSTITYTCIDFFSYQTTRQNDGYTINNDSSSDDYIGAKDVDWWISQKIVPECYISYTYLKLADNLVLNDAGQLVVNSQKATINKIIKRAYPKTDYVDYYETLAYSVKGSNANNALVTLAEQLDLMIGTAERLNEDGTLTRYFWLEPMKKEEVSGLTYSPYDNLSDFSFSHNGASLATVLNVDSVTVGDDLITLIPEVPVFFIDYFNSQEWANAKYSPNMFSRICQYQEYECQIENNKTYTLSGVTISNNYSFITLDFDESYAMIQDTKNEDTQLNLSSSYLQFTITTTDAEVQQNAELFLNNEIPESCRGHTVDIVISGYNFTKAKLMVRIARNPTQEELQFAKIADNCPWLENKIIDFTYFVENGLMSKQDYKVLMDIMRNKLRYVNSQLLVATQDYTRALHTRTETISRITNDLDELGAMYFNNIIKSYETNGCFTEVNDFVNKCESVLEAPRNIELFLRSDLITQYVNNYTNAQQRFLKNIYAFRNYFEDQFTGSGLTNPTIYNNILTLDTSVDYTTAGTYYIAEIANQTSISITNDLIQKSLSGTLDEWYYYNVFDANGVNKMIVTTDNCGKFVKLSPSSYSAVDANSRYDDTVTYYLKDEKDNYKAATKNDLLWAYKEKTKETNPSLTQNWGYLTTKATETALWKDKQTQGHSFYSKDKGFWYDWQGLSIVITYGESNKKVTIPVATVESYNRYYAINPQTFTPEQVSSLDDKVLFNNITSFHLSNDETKTVEEWLTLISDDSIKNVIFTSQASVFIEQWTAWFNDVESNINKIKQLVLTLGQVDYLVNTVLPNNTDTDISSVIYTSTPLRPALLSEIDNNIGLPKDSSSYITILYSKIQNGADRKVYDYNNDITTLNWKIFGISDIVSNYTQTISWISHLYSSSIKNSLRSITINNIQDVGSLVINDCRFIFLIKDTPYWTAWEKSSSDTIIDKDSRKEIEIPNDLCKVLNADAPVLFTLNVPEYTSLEKSDVIIDDNKKYRTDIIYYYTGANNEYIQAYNLLQAKNAGFSIYNRSQWSETTLGAIKNNWFVTLDLIQIVVSDSGQITRTTIDTITESLTWSESDTSNSEAKHFKRRSIKGTDGNYYQLAYNCSSAILEALNKLTNGNIWYRYHALNVDPSNPNSVDATLQQYAALIETTLSTYWDSAYTASINTDFVLPQYWQKSIDAEDNNNFFNNLFSTTNNSISIAENGLIPEVKLLSDSKANTEFTFYRYVFGAENLDKTLEVVKAASINNIAIQNALKRLPTDIYDNLYAQPYSEQFNTTYYYTEKHPLTHLEFITKYSTDVINIPYYSGWYLNMLYILDKYKEQTVWNYQRWLEQHNLIWQGLYNNYPNVILENKFTPEDASNSWEVYVLSKNAFKDLSYPEKDYSLKVINSTQLLMIDSGGSKWVKYADKELIIGEAIAINSNDLYKNFDEVKRSLQQYLFITDISYTLRNDADVQLTVNIIKYQDKIIRRLVNLIK